MEEKVLSADPPLTFELTNAQFKKEQVTKEEVKGVAGAFVLRGVLSEAECEALVDHIFTGPLEKTEPVLWRKWAESPEEEYKKLGIRLIQRSNKFAETLFSRVKEHFPATLQEGGRTWNLQGVSDRIRFIRYDAGQNFPPHTDGPFTVNNSLKSHLTFLIYLDKAGGLFSVTADFRGGELFFCQPETNDRNNLKHIFKVSPEPGLCVVFPHKTLHEGNTLKSGHKYVIRTDVMYSCDNTTNQNANGHSEGAQYQQEQDQH